MNPFKYKPSQIAKALSALIVAVVGLLGVVASTFTDGSFATIGQWATVASLFLVPIVVFLKKAEPWMPLLDRFVPTHEAE